MDAVSTPNLESVACCLTQEGFGWWHWLDNSWLLTHLSGNKSSADVRDKLKEILKGDNNLVLEFDEAGDAWSGYGPKSEGRDMFKWIHENWNK